MFTLQYLQFNGSESKTGKKLVTFNIICNEITKHGHLMNRTGNKAYYEGSPAFDLKF